MSTVQRLTVGLAALLLGTSLAACSDSGTVATVNGSGVTSVSFGSSYITASYNKYVVEFDDVYASAQDILFMTVSTNNGSSYLGTNYNFAYTAAGAVSGSAVRPG